MEQQIVVFDLADEQYGIDIASVESIIEMQPVTAIPRAPAFIEGVINLRGVVLPVIDLRKRFDLPAQEPTKKTRIIIVETDGLAVGMVVDAVTEVLRIPEDTVEPLSPLMASVDSAFIEGVAKLDERLIILVNLAQVLSSEEKAEVQPIQQA